MFQRFKGQLYCDMDGVLADFDQHHFDVFGVETSMDHDNVDWKKVHARGDFFLTIPPKPDMQELWDYIKPYKPKVLTGIPKSVYGVKEQKQQWIAEKLGPDVEVVPTYSALKYKYCTPGDILIDDWTKYKIKWLNAGGIWITHVNAKTTIVNLMALGL